MFGGILKATNSFFQKSMLFLSKHIYEFSYEATCIHI